MTATALAVAFIVFSCSSTLREADKLDLGSHPRQVIDNMFAVESENGRTTMRVEAPLMQRYETDTLDRETFPSGFSVFGYNDEGLLETTIVSDNAEHRIKKFRRAPNEEMWVATGNVVIQNVIKQETMETDTLYWDQATSEIYTDCYIRMYSADGFMQGFGMRSDDHARHAEILRPFNSFGVVVQDSTRVIIDSANFIGPFPKK